MIDQSDDELHGRCVLITGASQGIGRAVAVSCAVAGATVVACGRDVTALEDLADEIGLAGHTPPVLLPINLERAGIDDYLEVAHLIAQQFGALDGLVLNAAVLGELAPLAHYDAVTWAPGVPGQCAQCILVAAGPANRYWLVHSAHPLCFPWQRKASGPRPIGALMRSRNMRYAV